MILSYSDPREMSIIIPPNAAAEAVRELGGEKQFKTCHIKLSGAFLLVQHL